MCTSKVASGGAHCTLLHVGGQLWERVEAGRFSEAQAARIIREVLQLLAQAHSRNIIIRDIKPDNLLFLDQTQDAPLKAIDFGIATICSPTDVLAERCGEHASSYIPDVHHGSPGCSLHASQTCPHKAPSNLSALDCASDIVVAHSYLSSIHVCRRVWLCCRQWPG